MSTAFAAWWGRRKARVCAGLYLLALLLVAAHTFGGPLLAGLGVLQQREFSFTDGAVTGAVAEGPGALRITDQAAWLDLTVDGPRSLWVRCRFTGADGAAAAPDAFRVLYRTAAMPDFAPEQGVYAHQYGDWYAFPLPGGVQALRLMVVGLTDGSVTFEQLELDRRMPPRLSPAALLWGLLLPGFVYSVADTLLSLLARRGKAQTASEEGEGP